MAITKSQTQDAGVVQRAVGRYITTTTPVATVITCGFTPRYVRVINVDDRIEMEWFEGMTAGYAIRTVAAGTRTLLTTLGITVAEGGFTIGLETSVLVVDKQVSWIAFG